MDDSYDGLISITQMARWQNVTTETLRHYDRIGLLEPARRSPQGMRWYAPEQYERLGTIRDLAQSGMELADVRDYLRDRTVASSRELLRTQETCLQRRIDELQATLDVVRKQAAALDAAADMSDGPAVRLQDFPLRFTIASPRRVHDALSLARACQDLESFFRSGAGGARVPVYATNVFAARFPLDDWGSCQALFVSDAPFDAPGPDSLLSVGMLPAGRYLCTPHSGSLWNAGAAMTRLREHLARTGLAAKTCWAVDCVVVDWTVTDRADERLYRLQLLVEDDT